MSTPTTSTKPTTSTTVTKPITVTRQIHFAVTGNRKQVRRGAAPASTFLHGRTPRVAKLMALAIRFDRLLQDGVVADQSELARLAHVTQPRMTQIMNLLHLAPDIQEEILHLPAVTNGRDWITERHLRPITSVFAWSEQRKKWKVYRRSLTDQLSPNQSVRRKNNGI